ncbi:MAG: hypothetical protein K8S55_13320 [Phycisphaerae bacterium]|nr:hypothetical protein [Phycisphaerae bacterium]
MADQYDSRVSAGDVACLPTDEALHDNGPGLALLAAAMPWVISLLFHAGIFLVMLFFIFLVTKPNVVQEIIPPPGVAEANPIPKMASKPVKSNRKRDKSSQAKNFTRQKQQASAAKSNVPLNVIGPSDMSSPDNLYLRGRGKSSIFVSPGPSGGGDDGGGGGGGGSSNSIVYVIDRSGSMIDTFDTVRLELIRSIAGLRLARHKGRRFIPAQKFHVLFFSHGRPQEMAGRRLLKATVPNKKAAAEFLMGVIPSGMTDPIPALNRAFDVLNRTKKPGKLIHLLTDGVFPDNERVLRAIAARNKGKGRQKVVINTYLYGSRPPEAEEVLRRIARESGGVYSFVAHEP